MSLIGGAIVSGSHQLGHAFHARPDVVGEIFHTNTFHILNFTENPSLS